MIDDDSAVKNGHFSYVQQPEGSNMESIPTIQNAKTYQWMPFKLQYQQS